MRTAKRGAIAAAVAIGLALGGTAWSQAPAFAPEDMQRGKAFLQNAPKAMWLRRPSRS